MQTLSKQLLTLQRRYSAGLMGEAEYKQAVRERSGALLRQGGRLIKHELPSPVYSEHRGTIKSVRTVTGSQPEIANSGLKGSASLAGKTLVQFKAAPEVRLRDTQIAWAKALGTYGQMVKVIRKAR